jgi:sensor domain CHASE-containing protein
LGFSLRNFVGWRYVIAIALPLLLASLGVISLTTDLLNQVAGNADRAEDQRNRDIASRLLKSAEGDLLRLVGENAQWDEAAVHVYPTPDAKWIRSTWGSMNSLGHSYDRAAIFDATSGAVIDAVGGDAIPLINLQDYLGSDYEAVKRRLDAGSASPVSSFVDSPDGPAIIAAAPVKRDSAGAAAPLRTLAFIRYLDASFFAGSHGNTLVEDLRTVPAAVAGENGLTVNSLSGTPVFGLAWSNGKLGAAATSYARQKASLTLGFLILVMTGIGFVCWRLVKNLASNEE